MATAFPASALNRARYAFFAFLALCVALVLWADEYVVFAPRDPYWHRIAPFHVLLGFHGFFATIAFLAATAQFSTRLRGRPGVHRWTGRLYLAAVTASAPFAAWIGYHDEPATMHFEQLVQAGGWAATAWLAFAAMRRRDPVAHRRWAMRTYGFCLVFVASRVPDGIPGFHWNDQLLADVLWALVVAALVLPDLLLESRWLRSRPPIALR